MSRQDHMPTSNAYPPIFHQSSSQPDHSPENSYAAYPHDPYSAHETLHGYTPAQGRLRSESQHSLAPGMGFLPDTHGADHRAEVGGANLSRAASRRSILERVGVVPEGDRPDDFPPGWTSEDEAAEREFIKSGMFDWNAMRSWRFWIRKEWWYWYIGAIVLGVLVALMALYHDDIVTWLKPAANWMKALPAGWTIPIAVMFIMSFPPLFGQEIVAVLCGAVWGLWVGFGIVSAGTIFGEIGNFYAFKYCLRSRAEKYERENLNYAIMAHVVRDGGFFFVFAVRLSAIPGHFSTAVFATCGMGIIIFTLACVLTLPKQLVVVYLGVLFNEQTKSSTSKIISWVVLVVGGLITIWAMWYCYQKMNRYRVIVWRKQRMALAAKGVSIDPVTGARRRSSIKELATIPAARDEEEDMRSPILMKERNSTYVDPYESRVKDAIDERDIGYKHGYGVPPSEMFPQARPAQPSMNGLGVQRSATAVSGYAPSPESRIPTSFPVPEPAGGPNRF